MSMFNRSMFNKSISRLAALALVATSAMAAPVLNSTNGHLYDIVTARNITWSQANAATQGTGWSLASITNAAEQNFIAGLITQTGSYGEFWLGGYQTPGTTGSNANWNWTTGESFGYTSWAQAEPNDYYGSGSEQYLAIWGLGNGSSSLGWNDEGASGNITGYILEQAAPAAIPEPGTVGLLGAGLLAIAFSLRRRHTT
jgi:hypothetical protein